MMTVPYHPGVTISSVGVEKNLNAAVIPFHVVCAHVCFLFMNMCAYLTTTFVKGWERQQTQMSHTMFLPTVVKTASIQNFSIWKPSSPFGFAVRS